MLKNRTHMITAAAIFKAMILLISIACANLSLSAQTYHPVNMGPVILGNMQSQQLIVQQTVNREALRSALRRREAGGVASNSTGNRGLRRHGAISTGGRTANAASINVARGTTIFRPVAPMIMPQQLAAASGSQAARQETEKFYAGLLNAYKELGLRKNAPNNDVARAASFMAINCYYTYTGGRELTARQMDALREQFHVAYANDAGFQRLADRERQSNYESYAIMGMFIASAYESYKGAHQEGDAAKLQNLREIARKQLEATFGAPVDQLSFTNNGVEYR